MIEKRGMLRFVTSEFLVLGVLNLRVAEAKIHMLI